MKNCLGIECKASGLVYTFICPQSKTNKQNDKNVLWQEPTSRSMQLPYTKPNRVGTLY